MCNTGQEGALHLSFYSPLDLLNYGTVISVPVVFSGDLNDEQDRSSPEMR